VTPEPLRVVIVAAQNEAERIGAALDALAGAFPGARLMVADDASSDGTQQVAMRQGAWLISRRRPHGKGGNLTAAAEAAVGEFADDSTVLLCDADLGTSAGELVPLVEAVEAGRCDLAIGSFANREGGGFGFTLGYARNAVDRICGVRLEAPLSGQRAMRVSTLRELLPFADGWGLETGMTIDAIRAGHRIEEIELPLHHRTTGRTPAGFLHRAGQLRDIRRAVRSRSG
jgi:glycosyltransferase involved in cell wall biosynthesis